MRLLVTVLAVAITFPLTGAGGFAQDDAPDAEKVEDLRTLLGDFLEGLEEGRVDGDEMPMQDAGRWTGVQAWQGNFSVSYARDGVNNTASGAVRFDRLVEPGYWTGGGTADWKVDETSVDALGYEHAFKGDGDAPLDESSELVIERWNASYDLILLPGGEYGEEMIVRYSTDMPRFSDGGELGMPLPTEAEDEDQPAGIRPGLRLELEEMPLPRTGLRLCGSRTMPDGAEATWDFWPVGQRPSGPCPVS